MTLLLSEHIIHRRIKIAPLDLRGARVNSILHAQLLHLNAQHFMSIIHYDCQSSDTKFFMCYHIH